MDGSKTKTLPRNPREKASFPSKLIFKYTFPVFISSQKQNLISNDLYAPLKEHESGNLGSKLHKAWIEEVASHRDSPESSRLRRPILRVFGKSIFLLGIALFCLDFLLKLTQPFILGMLISRYSGPDVVSSLYLYAVALILCTVLNVLLSHTNMVSQFHCGMKIRIALVSMIYRKALRLSRSSFAKVGTGQIVNLLTNDAGKIDFVMIGLHQIWLGPLETLTIVGILIWKQIGLSALAGVLVLALLIPVQVWLGKKAAEFRKRTAEKTDVRIRRMNEIINGVQVIKMYAWEKPIGELVKLARKAEVHMIRKSNYVRGFNLACMMFVSRIAIFISLLVYALLGQIVTAEKAFVITAYYNILRQVMTVQFPRGIEQLGETLASLERIRNFMLLEERSERTDVYVQPTENTPLLKTNINSVKKTEETLPILQMNDVQAKWTGEEKTCILDSVSFTLYPGQHVAIIGKVGSGKSSILQTILGELSLVSGSIRTNNARISYASQEPWLFSGTVQDNIIFGQDFDEDRYKSTIQACVLESDLADFENGDQTWIGDRGQTLSGGQKARIGLARAIYRYADIYLLDDPLSAVDLSVGRRIMNNCIREILRYHIVVLVTHQIHFLSDFARIIRLDSGRVDFDGSYDELMATNGDLEKMKSYQGEYDGEIKDEEKIKSCIKKGTSGRGNNGQKVEETQQGSIGIRLYVKYIKYGGGFCFFFVVFLFAVLTQVFASGSDYFLMFWVNRNQNYKATMNATSTVHPYEDFSAEASNNSQLDMLPIYIFTGLTVGTIVVTSVRTLLLFRVATKASINLHKAMYRGIIRAIMHIFQNNPAGRIINRFSKDMGLVDEVLPTVMIEVLQIVMALVGVIVIVATVNLWSLLLMVVIGAGLLYLRRVYLNTSRNLKRMDGTTRSPVYSHAIESLNGLSTIQAFSAQDKLVDAFDSHQDTHSSVFYMVLSTRQAFGFYLDLICVVYIIFVTIVVLQSNNAGQVGLAITQVIGLTGMLQWGARQSAEMENHMTCVERIVEYETLEQEKTNDEKPPPDNWPFEGHIEFENLSFWYSPPANQTPVLNNISFVIKSGEKCGIVGRTGAGKSSLVNAIFRLGYIIGSIKIDGVDTDEISLEHLRRNISIIPQEPILFEGSFRYNLDPFGEYSDERLWQALNEVNLREIVSKTEGSLGSLISEKGQNLSVGEKQLLCLARAILRDNKILIMDEATANIDGETEDLIQHTLRKKFHKYTILVIAHRLHNLMDMDRILVIDDGHVIESDTPYALLSREDSSVYRMAKDGGESTYDNLLSKARKAYDETKDVSSVH